MAPSTGRSAQGYPAHRENSDHRGGQVAHNSAFGEHGWNPYGSTSARNLDENRYSGYTHQVTDVRMRDVSPPHLPQYDEGRSLGTPDWSESHYHSPSNPPIWDTTQVWGGYPHRSAQDQVMQPPSNSYPVSGATGADHLPSLTVAKS
jgi:hypothetical protein